MYGLIRIILIASVVLAGYGIVLLTILSPWIGAALAVAALCGVARRGYRYTAHGTARWSEASDLYGRLHHE
jgi:hypothetical protein